MVNEKTKSILVEGDKWEILQHIQWIDGMNNFLILQIYSNDLFNLEVRLILRETAALLIGAIRLVSEGYNTRIFFVSKPMLSPKSHDVFADFIKCVKDYFEGTIIQENGISSEITQIAQAIKEFSHFIESEKRMTFWEFENGAKCKKWVKNPEKHAKDLLQTFLTAKFGKFCTIEEIVAGAGKIDILFNSPIGESSIIELKMCGHNYSMNYANEGIEQLIHYKENRKVKFAYLIVFDSRVKDFSQGVSHLLDNSQIEVFFINVQPYIKNKDIPEGT